MPAKTAVPIVAQAQPETPAPPKPASVPTSFLAGEIAQEEAEAQENRQERDAAIPPNRAKLKAM